MIPGYVPAIGETDTEKITRSIRNIYENSDGWLTLGTVKKVGSFTRDLTLASSSQAITGTGFQPKLLILSTGITGGGAAFYSISGTDGTTTAGNGMLSGSSFTLSFAAAVGSDAFNYQSAVLTSFDTDGFTLAWTKTGTPTGTATIAYWAIL